MSKIFTEYCDKVKRYYELQNEISELKNAPYSKGEIKASLEGFFEEKNGIVNLLLDKVAFDLVGKSDVGRNFQIPLNRSHLKATPAIPADMIDNHFLIGLFADDLKAKLFMKIDAIKEGWGPSIPDRQERISHLEDELQKVYVEISFSPTKINRNRYWTDRLDDKGHDVWLRDASGIDTPPSIEKVYQWLTKEEKSFLTKIKDALIA